MTRLTVAKVKEWWGRVSSKPANVAAFCIIIFSLGVLLMVLPAELITFEPPSQAEIQLETTFASMSSQGWLCLALVLFSFILLIFDIVGADLAMNLTLALTVILKIITIKSALAGFANQGLLTVVTLFMVAQGITSTGGAEWIIGKLLGAPKGR